MSHKAFDLARLAADERTPEGERIAAALALAKLIARDGPPGGASVSGDADSALWRQNQALTEIVRQNADELKALREENRALMQRLKHR